MARWWNRLTRRNARVEPTSSIEEGDREVGGRPIGRRGGRNRVAPEQTASIPVTAWGEEAVDMTLETRAAALGIKPGEIEHRLKQANARIRAENRTSGSSTPLMTKETMLEAAIQERAAVVARRERGSRTATVTPESSVSGPPSSVSSRSSSPIDGPSTMARPSAARSGSGQVVPGEFGVDDDTEVEAIDKTAEAASKIQNAFRGFSARQKLQRRREQRDREVDRVGEEVVAGGTRTAWGGEFERFDDSSGVEEVDVADRVMPFEDDLEAELEEFMEEMGSPIDLTQELPTLREFIDFSKESGSPLSDAELEEGYRDLQRQRAEYLAGLERESQLEGDRSGMAGADIESQARELDEQRQKAAGDIQRVFRGHNARAVDVPQRRAEVRQEAARENAGATLSRVGRGFLGRLKARAERTLRDGEELDADIDALLEEGEEVLRGTGGVSTSQLRIDAQQKAEEAAREQASRNDAAAQIQGMFRGVHAREVEVPKRKEQVEQEKREDKAATDIQRVFRGRRARTVDVPNRSAEVEKEKALAQKVENAAALINRVGRGYLGREEARERAKEPVFDKEGEELERWFGFQDKHFRGMDLTEEQIEFFGKIMKWEEAVKEGVNGYEAALKVGFTESQHQFLLQGTDLQWDRRIPELRAQYKEAMVERSNKITEAATDIQRVFRGHHARTVEVPERQQQVAAEKRAALEEAERLARDRHGMEEADRESRVVETAGKPIPEDVAATRIQKVFRGHNTRETIVPKLKEEAAERAEQERRSAEARRHPDDLRSSRSTTTRVDPEQVQGAGTAGKKQGEGLEVKVLDAFSEEKFREESAKLGGDEVKVGAENKSYSAERVMGNKIAKVMSKIEGGKELNTGDKTIVEFIEREYGGIEGVEFSRNADGKITDYEKSDEAAATPSKKAAKDDLAELSDKLKGVSVSDAGSAVRSSTSHGEGHGHGRGGSSR